MQTKASKAIHAIREYLLCGIVPEAEDIRYLYQVVLPDHMVKPF